MKTPSRFLLSGFLLTALALAPTSLVHAADWDRGPSDADVVRSLQSQVLTADQIADLRDPALRTVRGVSDLQITTILKIRPAPSNVGIPALVFTAISDDVMDDAFSSAEHIEESLRQRLNYKMGDRIGFLQRRAAAIIQSSKERSPEFLLRLTLNRSVDVINHVRGIIGRNADYVAARMAKFLVDGFVQSATYGNSQVGLVSQLTQGLTDGAPYARTVSIADYGRVFASEQMLTLAQDPGITVGAQAMVLMRLLGYLGWDFNADLLRRERPLAQTIVQVYQLQHSPAYRRILSAFASSQEPEADDVAFLLDETSRLLDIIPGRLQQAGILPR